MAKTRANKAPVKAPVVFRRGFSLGLLVLWIAAACVLTLRLSQKVELDCDRARGTCVTTETGLTSRRADVSIAAIKGVRLGTHEDGRTGVVLVTAEMPFPLAEEFTKGDVDKKNEVVAALGAFLHSSEPRYAATYGSRANAWPYVLPPALLLALLISLVLPQLRVWSAGGKVMVTERKFGLLGTARTFDAGEVKKAEIATAQGLVKLRVVLPCGKDEKLVLRSWYTEDRAAAEALANEVDAVVVAAKNEA